MDKWGEAIIRRNYTSVTIGVGQAFHVRIHINSVSDVGGGFGVNVLKVCFNSLDQSPGSFMASCLPTLNVLFTKLR